MRKLRSYGFLIRTEKWADCPSVVAKVLVREGDAVFPINPRTDGEDSIWDAPKKTDGLYLQSLEVRCWQGDKYFTGPHVRVDNARFVDLRMAKRLLATMTRVEKQIVKSQAREAGDVLMAVARAIGATWSVHQIGKPVGSFYSEDNWRFGELTEARDDFRRLIDTIKLPEPMEVAS